MQIEEIRRCMFAALADIEGPIKIDAGSNKVNIWLKRRTEKDHLNGLDLSEKSFDEAQKLAETSDLEDKCRSRLELLEHDVLAKMATEWVSNEFMALGADLLDDLNPDIEETEEDRLKKRADRFREWQDGRFEELKQQDKGELIKLLAKRDLEVYARVRQANDLADIAVMQCVVDEGGNRVFKSLDDFRNLPHDPMVEDIRQHVRKFISIENQRVVREVAESPDFQESTG